VDATGAAGESFFDSTRGLMPGWFLRMAAAARGGHGEGHFDSWGGARRGPRAGFSFGEFGGRGFGRGRNKKRFQHRPDVRAAVLILLDEQPMHGYQIIQEIEERSGGVWQPSPGSVYPLLQQLEDEGLAFIEQGEGRKVANLTESGRAYVEQNRAELQAAWNAATNDVDDRAVEMRDLFALYKQTAVAAKQVALMGTESQLGEARKVLTETRRRLYLILAEGDTSDEQASGAADHI